MVKIKFPLYQTIRARGGGENVQLHSFVTSVLDGVSGQRNTLAFLPPGKEFHCIGGWVGPRQGLDKCGNTSPAEFEPRAIPPVGSDHAIPAYTHTHTHTRVLYTYTSTTYIYIHMYEYMSTCTDQSVRLPNMFDIDLALVISRHLYFVICPASVLLKGKVVALQTVLAGRVVVLVRSVWRYGRRII